MPKRARVPSIGQHGRELYNFSVIPYPECPSRGNPCRFWRRKAGLTAQNPRRHATGKPFHAFLTGWLGGASPRSDSGDMVCRRREVERRVEHTPCAALWPRSPQSRWRPEAFPSVALREHCRGNEGWTTAANSARIQAEKLAEHRPYGGSPVARQARLFPLTTGVFLF